MSFQPFALASWAQRQRQQDMARDDLVRGAVAAGISKHRVHVLMGIARTTIDKIMKAGGTMSAMTDAEFWAYVRGLIQPDGEGIGWLADYVTGDAERRDSELARLRSEKLAIFRKANERAGDDDPLELGSPAELTNAEQAAHDALNAAYRQRFTALAYAQKAPPE